MLAPYLIPATSQLLAGHFVVHFGDNQAANSVVIKVVFGSSDLNRIAGGFHRGLAASTTSIWIEWIRSELNIADLPSRSENGICPELSALGQRRFHLTFRRF